MSGNLLGAFFPLFSHIAGHPTLPKIHSLKFISSFFLWWLKIDSLSVSERCYQPPKPLKQCFYNINTAGIFNSCNSIKPLTHPCTVMTCNPKDLPRTAENILYVISCLACWLVKRHKEVQTMYFWVRSSLSVGSLYFFLLAYHVTLNPATHGRIFSIEKVLDVDSLPFFLGHHHKDIERTAYKLRNHQFIT